MQLSGSFYTKLKCADSSHATELVSRWRAWPDASGTSSSDAPLEPLRRGLSERLSSRERAAAGEGQAKVWGQVELLRGEKARKQWSIPTLTLSREGVT